MNSSERIELLNLLARESYFERELTLASGRSSNYYNDCKRTLYIPLGAYLAGEAILEIAVAAGVAQLGGMAAGALPVTDAAIAAAVRELFAVIYFALLAAARTSSAVKTHRYCRPAFANASAAPSPRSTMVMT